VGGEPHALGGRLLRRRRRRHRLPERVGDRRRLHVGGVVPRLTAEAPASHDLYASVIAKGKVAEDKEVRISKLSAIVIGIVAIMLGYIFENQNVAFMVGLAFAVAASCNFPVLLMSVFWKGTTSRGALIGGLLGLVSAVTMVVLSPAVWVKTFGFKAALFP
jgi:cation/acetate symporter